MTPGSRSLWLPLVRVLYRVAGGHQNSGQTGTQDCDVRSRFPRFSAIDNTQPALSLMMA